MTELTAIDWCVIGAFTPVGLFILYLLSGLIFDRPKPDHHKRHF